MKLNAGALGLAAGLTAAAVSAVCALFVAFAPQLALSLLSDVVHADLTGLTGNVTVATFFGALFFWSVGTGVVFGAAGALYNGFSQPRSAMAQVGRAAHQTR